MNTVPEVLPSNGPQKDPLLERSRLETLHSYRTQLKPVKALLYGSILSLTGDQRYAQSLSDYIVEGVLYGGNGFLSKHRHLYILGLRYLGRDPRLEKVPIKHFNPVFKVLDDLSKAVIDPGYRSCWSHVERTYIDESFPFYRKPTKVEVEKASLALFILRFPYFVRLPLNAVHEKAILKDFSSTVTDMGISANSHSYSTKFSNLSTMLFRSLGTSYSPNSLVVDLSRRTYKGQKSLRKVPVAIGSLTGDLAYYKYSYKGPVARATVLSEKAGKTRIIVGYDGLINSTDLYDRSRSMLNKIKQDVSDNQISGHAYMATVLDRAVNKHPTNQLPFILSADLKAFSDSLYPIAFMPILEHLGAEDFYRVISSEIIVDGKTLTPTRMLMGLRGTFEVSSLAHHSMVQPISQDYVMCGDDLLMVGNMMAADTLAIYKRQIDGSGLVINDSKTITSQTVAVFCGKACWLGEILSIPTIPTFTLYETSMAPYDLVRSCGDVVTNVLQSTLSRINKSRVIGTILRFFGILKPFRGRPLPKSLPVKLGGIGSCARLGGLLQILQKKWIRYYARVPRTRILPDTFVQKQTIIIRDEPSKLRYDFSNLELSSVGTLYGMILRSSGFFTNLLKKGFYSVTVKQAKTLKSLRKIDSVYDLLEYYYFDKCIECSD